MRSCKKCFCFDKEDVQGGRLLRFSHTDFKASSRGQRAAIAAIPAAPAGHGDPSLPTTTFPPAAHEDFWQKTATVLSRIEEEQVENAFCLCVGS